jgi:hypothetical protein
LNALNSSKLALYAVGFFYPEIQLDRLVYEQKLLDPIRSLTDFNFTSFSKLSSRSIKGFSIFLTSLLSNPGGSESPGSPINKGMKSTPLFLLRLDLMIFRKISGGYEFTLLQPALSAAYRRVGFLTMYLSRGSCDARVGREE